MKILGKHKKIDMDFWEIFTAEFISVTGGIIAGVLLSLLMNKLELIPALLVLLPGFLEMRGNIAGSLASRLGTDLHIKKLYKLKDGSILRDNVLSSVILGIIVTLSLGFFAYLLTYFLFGINNINIIFIALIASILAMTFEIPLTVITTFWLFKKGYDPDDIMGPYVTAVGDVVSILAIVITINLII